MNRNILNEVMTFAEATEKWGLGESTLRSTVNTNKLIEGIDYRKSGKVWLVTYNAMLREYGEPEIPRCGFSKEEDEIFKEIQNILDSHKVKYNILKNEELEEEYYISVPVNQTELGGDAESTKEAIASLKSNNEYNESFQIYANKKKTRLIITYLKEFS